MKVPRAPDICVIGAGIAGLAAGWEIKRRRPDCRLEILDGSKRPGGVIKTSEFAGLMLDEAADAFLSREQAAEKLCDELSLTSLLVSPITEQACVYLNGKLQKLPAPHFLGLPTQPEAIDPDLLSAEGLATLRADLTRPASTKPPPPSDDKEHPEESPDQSIDSLIRSRVGAEVAEKLVGPMVSTISAGDARALSLQALTPRLAEAASHGGSLIEAVRQYASGSKGAFLGMRGGMERLPSELARRLGASLRLETPAVRIQVRSSNGGVRVTGVETPRGTAACSAVVLCTPAGRASDLLQGWAPNAARLLKSAQTASVAIVSLAYKREQAPLLGEMSGCVVPREAGLVVTACSQSSVKWAHLSREQLILRASVGRVNQPEAATMPDLDLLSAVRADLSTMLGIEAKPTAVRISRWLDAFPQYNVGHLLRLRRIEEELSSAGVFLAGASYRGIGIEPCILSGQKAGAEALAWCGAI